MRRVCAVMNTITKEKDCPESNVITPERDPRHSTTQPERFMLPDLPRISRTEVVARAQSTESRGNRVIKLWRHAEENDWSVEVGGRLHKHVSTKTVDELVEYVLVAAQQALLARNGPKSRDQTKRNLSKGPGEIQDRKR